MLELQGDPRRVLLVRLSHLGDVVTTLPLAAAVRTRWPGARVAWAVERAYASVLVGHPALDELLVHDRGGGFAAARRFRAELRRFDADLAIDAQGNAKSALWTRAAGAVHTVGLGRADWQEPWASMFVGSRAPVLGRDRHAVERAVHLARHVTGLEIAATLDLGLDATERERGGRRWAELSGDAHDAPLLHLSPADDVRGWPSEHWAELAGGLSDGGRAPVLVAGPREADAARRVDALLAARGVAPRGRWYGPKDLRELAATLAAAGAGGARMACVDTGPMHLASAVGLETLALLGPTDARRTGPWPLDDARVVRSPEPLDCAPCVARRCGHPRGPVCLTELRPDLVLEQLLGGAGNAR